MASSPPPSLLRWTRRAAGVAAAALLVACQVIVPSDLDDISCSEQGAVGPPACPAGSVCDGGVCTPCSGASCRVGGGAGAGEGGESSEGGAAGDGGQGGGTSEGGQAGGFPQGGAGGKAGGGGAGQGGAGQGGAGQGGAGSAGASAGMSGGSGQGGEAGQSGAGGEGAGQGGAGAGQGGAGQAGQGGAGQGGAGAPPVPPGKLGEPCGDGDSCENNLFCRPLEDWGKSDGKVCTRACCTSDDCGQPGNKNVCMPTVLGGGMCLSATNAGRTSVGSGAQGADCKADGAAACRSGWCADGVCQDLCCSDGCTGGTCGLRGSIFGSSLKGLACGAAVGAASAGAQCGTVIDPHDDQCSSGACALTYLSQLDPNSYCSRACRKDSECASLQTSPIDFVYCDYDTVGGTKARVCVDSVNGAPRPCATDGDCAGSSSGPSCRPKDGVLRCQ